MQFKSFPLWVAGIFLATGSVCNVYVNGAEGDEPIDTPAAAQTTQADQAQPTAPAKPVNVTEYDTVSLNVQNTDLAQVLQLLSIQGKRNIVPSPKVDGKVTANLYDVTFHEALDAILQQNGCGYREKGNFIYIYTVEELRKIDQAERRLAYRVMKLNYLTATDASTFVTPLLSSAGSIAISGSVAAGFQPSLSDGGANSYSLPDTMVVRDYQENIEEIAKVIKMLDVRPKQVLVEATILKADVTENNAFGVDFSILTNIAVDAFTNPLNAVTDLIKGNVQPTRSTGAITSGVGNVADGQGGLKVGVVTGNVAAFIRALDSVTDTTIVANPKLLALNRQKADVLIGEKIGYLSTTATATATTQTVEFLDTGTQLTMRPFVSDDGFIRLELRPQISSARIRDVVPGTSTAAITIPDEVTQELTTNVMVQDGQTVVLGGLFKEETTVTRDQIPLLGDIPIAGAAFQGRDDTMTRSEVIFLITPHIIRDKALYAAGDSSKDGIEMARIGAREGLLPWSRTKMTAAHLRDALGALESGDKDTALYEVDLALGLDPRQVEAIRMKEKLTGRRAYWPERSLMNDAVDLMVERATQRRRAEERARPMQPDPRPSKPVSDNEPMIKATTDAKPAEPLESEPTAAAKPSVQQQIIAELQKREAQKDMQAAKAKVQTEIEPVSVELGQTPDESMLVDAETGEQPAQEETTDAATAAATQEATDPTATDESGTDAAQLTQEQASTEPQVTDGAEQGEDVTADATQPQAEAQPEAQQPELLPEEEGTLADLLRGAIQKFGDNDEPDEAQAAAEEADAQAEAEAVADAEADDDAEAPPAEATTAVEVDDAGE